MPDGYVRVGVRWLLAKRAVARCECCFSGGCYAEHPREGRQLDIYEYSKLVIFPLVRVRERVISSRTKCSFDEGAAQRLPRKCAVSLLSIISLGLFHTAVNDEAKRYGYCHIRRPHTLQARLLYCMRCNNV